MRVSSVFVSLKNMAPLLEVRNFTPGPFPCQGRQELEEKATICSVAPAGFLLCFTSHCVKDGEKPSCPLQDSASAPSFSTG